MELIIKCDHGVLLELKKQSISSTDFFEYLHSVSCESKCATKAELHENDNLIYEEVFSLSLESPTESPTEPGKNPWWKFW